MVNGWKVTAIIFIILFIVETLLFGLLVNLGTNEINKEQTCNAYCGEKEYDSFIYQDNICSCYLNNKIVEQIPVK